MEGESGQLTPDGSRAGDGFGGSVAADGTTLLVGAFVPAAGGGGRGRGAGGGAGAATAPPAAAMDSVAPAGSVSVFKRGVDGKYSSAGKLTAPSSAPQFGAALAVAGDLALIGSPGETTGGAVYVFRRSGDGQWSAAGTLPAQELVAGDRFGAAIAMDGDRVVVGAPGRDLKGAVFVFMRGSDGTWSQETMQISRRLPDNAQLGLAVAIKGDRVFAGAPTAAFAPVPAPVAAPGAAAPAGGGGRGRGAPPAVPGVVAVFEINLAKHWVESAALAPFDMEISQFGAALATVGDELWIGAPGSNGVGRIYRAKMEKDGSWGGMTKLVVDSIDASHESERPVRRDVRRVGRQRDHWHAG